MSGIRILATEDDTLHEEMLRIMLDKPGYDLVDVIHNPNELFLKINATKPDILLMDIDLGTGISGIDLMKEVNERYDIPVIYLTSYADNNTFQQAKETYPTAYIVKPYRLSELERAIDLAVYNHHVNFSLSKNRHSNVVLSNQIYLKEDHDLIKINLKSIQLIEAYDKYCIIYTEEKKRMIRCRLKDILEQLPTSLFCQVHRSYVINVDEIDKISVNSRIIYVAGKGISVSKRYKQNLFTKLNCIA